MRRPCASSDLARSARVVAQASLCAVLAVACGADADDADDVGRAVTRIASPIIAGTDSPPSQDSVVLVMHYDAIQIGGAAAGCTGTLLAPRLVLTARHCVADTDPGASCDADGKPISGGVVNGDHTPAKLFAFAGNQRPDFLSGLDKGARGVEIIDDQASTLCNHDIALLLLDRPLPGTHISPVRLDDGPRKDELVTVVGWGVSDKAPTPQTRQTRAGVKITEVGPAQGLGPAEFTLGESGCAGDSGGPAFAEMSGSGAILGVLSRGGNGSDAPAGDAARCIDAVNIFTSVAKYKDLLLSAYAKAGQEPWYEGQPDPTLAPAVPPAPADDDGGGCGVAAAPVRRSSGATLLALLAVLACVSRRRPRSSRA